jgi:hypothetical protein
MKNKHRFERTKEKQKKWAEQIGDILVYAHYKTTGGK